MGSLGQTPLDRIAQTSTRRRWAILLVAGIVLLLGGWFAAKQVSMVNEVRGLVTAEGRPLAGAVVRIKATTFETRTDDTGRFLLRGFPPAKSANITAWAEGYYIVGATATLGNSDVSITLTPHPTKDNSDYRWLSALSSAGQEANCQNCHSDPSNVDSLRPFDEWRRDAHGTSAVNKRFLSMYNGTDLNGILRSPPTSFVHIQDYGKVPLPPDPNNAYYGPGFKLDNPDSAGNCAACHLPAAAANDPYHSDPNSATGVGLEGVACDFCHKISSVKLDVETGLPRSNMPGVLSIGLLRPPNGHQIFIGPYDDVAPGEDTYSPLQNQSQLCAPCHFGQFWGTQVYNSFGEWLSSPYSDPVTGQTCQDCHMPRRGATVFARPDKGAVERDPGRVFSHLMPGASDVALLRDTARLELVARKAGDQIQVNVTVVNDRGGHHIPTDHPARNIILVVSAKDASGKELEYLGDQRIPDWGGKGNNPDDYAGRPGKGYAKVLEELWTKISPTAAYWRQTVVREDTRIPARASDRTGYVFRTSSAGPVAVEARLIFRRAFKELAQAKKWELQDIEMEREVFTIN